MAVTKRVKAWKAKLTPGKTYPVEEAGFAFCRSAISA